MRLKCLPGVDRKWVDGRLDRILVLLFLLIESRQMLVRPSTHWPWAVDGAGGGSAAGRPAVVLPPSRARKIAMLRKVCDFVCAWPMFAGSECCGSC